jgi:hypothetical protein
MGLATPFWLALSPRGKVTAVSTGQIDRGMRIFRRDIPWF